MDNLNNNISIHKTSSSQQPKSIEVVPDTPESITSDQHVGDRLLFLFGSMLGSKVTVRTKSRETFTGIFAGLDEKDTSLIYTLKMTRSSTSMMNGTSTERSPRSDQLIGTGPEHAMNFKAEDVVDLQEQLPAGKDSSPTRKGVTSSFRTDNDIAGKYMARERALQKWTPGPDSGHEFSLGAPSAAGHPTWDQFETNQRLFDVGTDFDENLYTTAIDRDHPDIRQQYLRAEKLAKEIERGPAVNAHVAEERGLARSDESELNEEDLYSGVRRTDEEIAPLQMGQANAYLPPGRRSVPMKDTPYSKIHNVEKEERTQLGNSRTQPAITAQQGRQLSSAAPAVPRAPAPSISHGSVGPIKTLATGGESMAPLVNGTTSQAPTASRDESDGATQQAASKGVDQEFTKMLGEYHDFAKEEKLRMETKKREYEKSRRMKKEADRESRTAELKKFAASFKLDSVPSGELLPILAKDPDKQRAITEKAEQDKIVKQQEKVERLAAQKQYEARVAAEKESEKASTQAEMKQKSSKARSGESAVESLQKSSSAAQAQGLRPARNTGSREGASGTSVDPRYSVKPRPAGQTATLHDNTVRSPHALPPRPAAPAAMPLDGQTPLSPASAALRFNVQATEFRPNPAASSFKPPVLSSQVSVASSRPGTRADTSPQSKPKKSFWGSRKPLPVAERPSIEDAFNPIKRMRRDYEKNKASLPEHHNVIKPAFTTDPLWGEPNCGKSYKEFYTKAVKSPSPASRSRTLQQTPQSQQLPYQMQPNIQGANGPQMMSMPYNASGVHSSVPYQGRHGSIPGMPQQFMDPRMAPPSPTAVMQSPHLAQPGFVYPSSAGGAAQMIYGQPMPQYAPMYNHPQYMHLRPHPGHSPMMVAPGTPQMGTHVVVQTVNGPQVMSVPQTPQMGYPQVMYGSPTHSQGFASPMNQGYPTGPYPSPRPAPLMMSSRQGSRQSSHAGQQMPMAMSPHQGGPHMYNNGGHPGQASMMRHYSTQFSGSPRMGHRFPMQGPPPQMPAGPHHSHSSQSYHSGTGGNGGGYGNIHGMGPSTPGSGHP